MTSTFSTKYSTTFTVPVSLNPSEPTYQVIELPDVEAELTGDWTLIIKSERQTQLFGLWAENTTPLCHSHLVQINFELFTTGKGPRTLVFSKETEQCSPAFPCTLGIMEVAKLGDFKKALEPRSVSKVRKFEVVISITASLVLNLSRLKTNIEDYFNYRYPHDVRLVFPSTSSGRSHELYVRSETFAECSPYFKALLAQADEESSGTDVQTSKRRKKDSDVATSVKFEHHVDVCEGARGDDEEEALLREITITSSRYSTFRAVLVWLMTGHVTFASLSSSFNTSDDSEDEGFDSEEEDTEDEGKEESATESEDESGDESEEKNAAKSEVKKVDQKVEESPEDSMDEDDYEYVGQDEDEDSEDDDEDDLNPSPPSPPPRIAYLEDQQRADPSLPLPVSPKSVYRLAKLAELPALAKLALESFESSLTVKNAAVELFGNFSGQYPEARKVVMEFAVRNWKNVKASKGMKEVERRVKKGKLPHFSEIIFEVMRKV
ncbi:hypothetical protein MNV49_000963 [Pseudohyphozyma bogoriensis]|nr:hypothetical protein MNV49_000963 [Pseudohyphozyma bogoriensis]